MATTKHKLVGRIAFGSPSDNSQVYWKCPTRGCSQIHYFKYIPASPGTLPVYSKDCTECNKSYTASHLFVSGSSITLAAVFKE